MERAGRLIGKLKHSASLTTPEDLARAAWPVAVGKRLANRTGRVSMVRKIMVVEVEDAVWQRQLFTLRNQILWKVEQVIGAGIVDDIEFRIGIPRRAPQRAESPLPFPDEADGIQDPVFRILYIASRKKASA